MGAHVIDDEIQPIDEPLRAALQCDEHSRVMRNILVILVSKRDKP